MVYTDAMAVACLTLRSIGGRDETSSIISATSVARTGKDIQVPSPGIASTFLAQLQTEQVSRKQRLNTIEAAQKTLDDLVIAAYGIANPCWVDLINAGVPWSR